MQYHEIVLNYLKVMVSPTVSIVFLIIIAFLLSKNELFKLIRQIKFKFKDIQIELAMGEEKEGDKESSIIPKDKYTFRIMVMLVLSDFIEYEKREELCKVALENFGIKDIVIEGFGSNLLWKNENMKTSNKNIGNTFTRINFFILSDSEIHPVLLKEMFNKYFKESKNISVLDYVIYRELMIKV